MDTIKKIIIIVTVAVSFVACSDTTVEETDAKARVPIQFNATTVAINSRATFGTTQNDGKYDLSFSNDDAVYIYCQQSAATNKIAKYNIGEESDGIYNLTHATGYNYTLNWGSKDNTTVNFCAIATSNKKDEGGSTLIVDYPSTISDPTKKPENLILWGKCNTNVAKTEKEVLIEFQCITTILYIKLYNTSKKELEVSDLRVWVKHNNNTTFVAGDTHISMENGTVTYQGTKKTSVGSTGSPLFKLSASSKDTESYEAYLPINLSEAIPASSTSCIVVYIKTTGGTAYTTEITPSTEIPAAPNGGIVKIDIDFNGNVYSSTESTGVSATIDGTEVYSTIKASTTETETEITW